MRLLHLPLLLAGALALGGCASLSKDQCLGGDWRQIGFYDGIKGLPSAELDKHAKACAEYGVQTDFERYHAGRSKGLLNYCQPESAFQEGRAGRADNVAACPPNLQRDFHGEYRRGAEIYAMESQIANLRSQLSSNDDNIRSNNRRIHDIRTALDRSDLGADARKNLLSEFNRLVNDNNAMTRDNGYLHRDLDRRYDMLRLRLRDFGR
ncbi:hypothetical protein ACFDR9_005300 [Janthinobacterium sp. CG_23.3]|uniref:DUF2799 domain-containing protein n=1 Tax=Janthinobacterium sp. CG_23.3 TaxID=3349634 RepID=UPI0038D48C75